MEFQNPASNFAILSDSWDMKTNGLGQEEGSPPVGLNLVLGYGSDQSIKCSSAFTFLQLQELQLHSLIYKYMEAGLPVPYHLVLPIWKSFASSHGILNGGMLTYPNRNYEISTKASKE